MFRKKHKTLEPLAFITCGAIINYLTQSFFGNIMPFTAPAFYFVIGIAIKYVDLNLEKQDKNNDIIEANKENSEEVLNKEEINQETNV